MKTVLKPFDVEEAKSGAKVVTRDGHNVRVICYDMKDPTEYSVIALIDDGEFENLYCFTSNGIYNDGNKNCVDLLIKEEEFEDGDIVAFKNRYTNDLYIGIFKSYACHKFVNIHIGVCNNNIVYGSVPISSFHCIRLASSKEIEMFCNILASSGKKCNNKDIIYKPGNAYLMRNHTHDLWTLCNFSHMDGEDFVSTGGNTFCFCIPFNTLTQHLLGTPDEY